MGHERSSRKGEKLVRRAGAGVGRVPGRLNSFFAGGRSTGRSSRLRSRSEGDANAGSRIPVFVRLLAEKEIFAPLLFRKAPKTVGDMGVVRQDDRPVGQFRQDRPVLAVFVLCRMIAVADEQ